MSNFVLNDEQQKAFDTVMSGVNCFITGGAGTGKTYLTRAVVSAMQDNGKNVMVVAPTGVAASTAGGVTVHRGFGLPATACINEKTMTSKVRVSKPLSVADVVVIDEVSMVRMDLFDSIIASIRKAESKAGKRIQVVVVGDFCQLPPILRNSHGERELMETFYKQRIDTPYAFLGNEWRRAGFSPIVLTKVVRQGDTEFIRNLNLARIGDMDCIPYFNEHCRKNAVSGAVHLYSTNRDVDAENLRSLDSIEGENYIFNTVFDGSLDRQDIKDIPKQVILKQGARVMVTTNDTSNVFTEYVSFPGKRVPYKKDEGKFYNGSLGTVIELGQYEEPSLDYAVVRLDSGPILFFYRQSYPVYQYTADDGKIRRVELGKYSQFPLRPAYAVTIHKSQGQTYESANIDPYCRNAGQLYVALSRVRSIEGIHLENDIEPWNLVVDPVVKDFYDNLGREESLPVITEMPAQMQEKRIIKKPTPRKAETTKPETKKPLKAKTVSSDASPRKNQKKKGPSPTPKGGRPPRFPLGQLTCGSRTNWRNTCRMQFGLYIQTRRMVLWTKIRLTVLLRYSKSSIWINGSAGHRPLFFHSKVDVMVFDVMQSLF